MSVQEEMNKELEVKSPQTFERAEVAAHIWTKYQETKQVRDNQHELFRDRTLKDWIDDNVKRFIQFKRRPAHKKPWQSNLASSTANEKLIGIISKLAMQGMEAKAVSTKELSQVEFVKEKISNYLLKHAAKKNNDDFQLVLEMLEAGEKGIVIGMEDWLRGECTRIDIQDQDPVTGELTYVKTKEKEWNDVRSSLVNLEDFVPGSINVRPGMVQDMDFCFLRSIMTGDDFKAEFGKVII